MSLPKEKILSTKEKALHLNLQSHIYGAFAEIGAGQEVANHFFKVGAASGSVAKTTSAYDMALSDAIYGKTKRYVSRERLLSMLDVEYNQLNSTLHHRSADSNFFVLANTIETLNYHKSNQGQGWMGLRFQLAPNAPFNDCIIHMVLHDNDPLLQQQVVGIVGVNLMYACYHFHDSETFVRSLLDGLSSDRVEINVLEFKGPNFTQIDNRLISLLLVENDLTKMTMFAPNRQVLQPMTSLYKKDLLILRGRFRPITKVHLNMFENAYVQFKEEPNVSPKDILKLAELTLSNLKEKQEGKINTQDFLDRADLLCSLGYTVIVSNFKAHYQMTKYLHQFVKKRALGIIVGMQNLKDIFDESYYDNLSGGILASFSTLFEKNTTLYVYPCIEEGKEHTTCNNIELDPHLNKLFQYFLDSGKIKDIKTYNSEYLHINSDEVLKMIQLGKGTWEDMVPEQLSTIIKEKKLFRPLANEVLK